MTDLRRRVVRRAMREPEAGVRRLVIALEPGDVIAIHELGRRLVLRTTIERVYWWMMKQHAAEQAAERRRARAERRRARA